MACNDYYSKQNSIKIRNVLNDKRKNGKFIGSQPCYGYMRDPLDKGHLIPNPETAHQKETYYAFSAPGTASPSTLNPCHQRYRLRYYLPVSQVHIH